MENFIKWESFEENIGDKIPCCIKKVLNLCGFDTFFSLLEISQSQIVAIEDCMTKHFSQNILELECSHSAYYRARKDLPFKLLPGHEILILALPKHIRQYRERAGIHSS